MPAAAHVIFHPVRSIKQTPTTAVHATLSLPSLFLPIVPAPFPCPPPARSLALCSVHQSIHPYAPQARSFARRRPAPSSLPLSFPFFLALSFVCAALRAVPGPVPGRPGTIQIFSSDGKREKKMWFRSLNINKGAVKGTLSRIFEFCTTSLLQEVDRTRTEGVWIGALLKWASPPHFNETFFTFPGGPSGHPC